MEYPDHLKAYLEKHKISEFIEINPLLREFTTKSTELVLKIDIEATSRLSKLKRLKTTVAKILGLKSRTLRLLDVNDGCIAATFLLPTLVAELVFTEHTALTDEQSEQLRNLSVLRLECNNCVPFENDHEGTKIEEPNDGCIAATFLLPTLVAELVFTEHTALTDEQSEQLRNLSVLRLECNNCVPFENDHEGTKIEEPVSRYVHILL